VQSSKPENNDHQNFQKASPTFENDTNIQTVGNAGGAVVDVNMLILIGHVKAEIL